MRNNILNKAIGTVKTDSASGVLEEIRARSAEITQEYMRKKEKLEKDLADAQRELEAGKAAQERAENIDDYDKASETVRRAELKIRFATNALEKFVKNPRMSDEEYDNHVDACRQIMEKAGAEFRTKTLSMMEEIRKMRDSYLALTENVDATLEILDGAANVLQTRYPDHIDTYVRDANSTYDVRTPDPNEWKNHTVRFMYSGAYHLALKDDNPRSSLLGMTWETLSRSFPEQSSRRY